MKVITDRFKALGTTIEGGFLLEPRSAHALFAELRQRIGEFERHFSRFYPSSELSQLNHSAGWPTVVSNELIDLLLASRRMWVRTEGLFDPTVGKAVIAAGYDESFEHLKDHDTRVRQEFKVSESSFGDVIIDDEKGVVTLPPGVALDIGGVGKGYLLDRIAPLVRLATENFWLSFGGDMIVSGFGEKEIPWSIGVQDPHEHARDLFELRLPSAFWGVGTSGTTKRHGTRGGVPWHHLIDPRTGQPSTSDVLAATVIAPNALEADAMAKTVLLHGSQDGIKWAEKQKDIEALVITETGDFATEGMKSYLTRK